MFIPQRLFTSHKNTLTTLKGLVHLLKLEDVPIIKITPMIYHEIYYQFHELSFV